MSTDIQFMQRAFELAALGKGRVSPNPMVGCVIVHHGIIIGEGWHQQYGGPHAEVNAVVSVKDQSILAEATVYVTLEPCSHFGKTPPCANLLVKHHVKKVIVASADPNPLVAGKGIKILQDAGIETETGLLAEQGEELNKRFFTFFIKKRPYVILKWAETADGFVARENFDSKWISSALSRKLVHKWRAEEDAILVGTHTAEYDNPSLNVRDWTGKNPVRIVLDRNRILPDTLHLFNQTHKTICYNAIETKSEKQNEFVQLDFNENIWESIFADLYQRNISSVIIEGGSKVLQSLIDHGLWDEVRQFKSKTVSFEKGIPAPHFKGKLVSQADSDRDMLHVWKIS